MDGPRARRIIVILLIAALAYGIVRWRLSAATTVVQHSVPASGESIRSIAVLPLDNFSGDPNQEYFSDGMTDELTPILPLSSALRVISRTSVMQFQRSASPADPEIAKASTSMRWWRVR